MKGFPPPGRATLPNYFLSLLPTYTHMDGSSDIRTIKHDVTDGSMQEGRPDASRDQKQPARLQDVW